MAGDNGVDRAFGKNFMDTDMAKQMLANARAGKPIDPALAVFAHFGGAGDALKMAQMEGRLAKQFAQQAPQQAAPAPQIFQPRARPEAMAFNPQGSLGFGGNAALMAIMNGQGSMPAQPAPTAPQGGNSAPPTGAIPGFSASNVYQGGAQPMRSWGGFGHNGGAGGSYQPNPNSIAGGFKARTAGAGRPAGLLTGGFGGAR